MAGIPVHEDPNPYLRSYYAAKGLKPGDTWVMSEYMEWVDTKAAEFWRSDKRTPEETAAFGAFLEREAKLEYQRSHGELIQVLIPIDELANRCGHFFNAAYNGGPCVNNGYNCDHPDAEQEGGVGCCYTKECPIAYPADGLTCRRCGISCENCGDEDCVCDLDMMVAEIPASEYDPTVMDLIPDGPDTKRVQFAVFAYSDEQSRKAEAALAEADFPGEVEYKHSYFLQHKAIRDVYHGAVEIPVMKDVSDAAYEKAVWDVLEPAMGGTTCTYAVMVDELPGQETSPEKLLASLVPGGTSEEARERYLTYKKKALFEQLGRL